MPLRRGFSSPGFDQGKDSEFDSFIHDVVRDVAELPDRTSPEDQPDMMLVSANELKTILATRLVEALAGDRRKDGLAQAANWLRRQGSAEKEPKARAAFIEAHNSILALAEGRA